MTKRRNAETTAGSPGGALDLNALSLPEVFDALTGHDDRLARLLALARDEDIDETGDVTTDSIVDGARIGSAALAARQPGVVAGLAVVGPLLLLFDSRLKFEPVLSDGQRCEAGDVLASVHGPVRSLLTAERTLLNLTGRLCGVATLTARYLEAVRGTAAVICDTRKTTPGLRGLEKYAVRCGGGTLHRIGLYDAALYKDNHLAGLNAEDLGAAVRAAVSGLPDVELKFVEVEVDTLDQLDALLTLEPGLVDIVLLDNMTTAQLSEAVSRRDGRAPALLLEASGGVNIDTVRAIAETGVDRISVGALTHGAVSLDLGLDIDA